MLRPWPTAAFALLALSVVVSVALLCVLFVVSRRLGRHAARLASSDQRAQAQRKALQDAHRELSRLRRIPRAQLMPMLKLAHELRSPLAAIQNSLDMVLQGYADDDAELRDEMLDLARDRSVSMLDRVNDFLRLGAVRDVEAARAVQPVHLDAVLRRLIPELRVMARWRAVELLIDISASLPAVDATPEDMEHLLSNLVNNAIKYTEPGGKVQVSLRRDHRGVVGVVEDTGIGIPDGDIDRIFEEFYRAPAAKDVDAHGSGLGLSIAKSVVDLHGGSLGVESELGKGSKFTFVFPVGTASPSTIQPTAK